MDAARKRILRALAEKPKLDMKSLSVGMGRNPTYLQQYLNRGSPKKLSEDNRRYLAEQLGIPESELGAPAEPAVERKLADVTEIRPSSKIDRELLYNAIRALEESLQRNQRSFSPEERAESVLILYDYIALDDNRGRLDNKKVDYVLRIAWDRRK